MARNGSGVYSLPAGNPVTTGTTISSTWANTTLTDISNTLTASIAYDGQTVPIANLPMGGNKHTGVGNANVRTNYASAADVQDGSITYLTSVSGTDTILATGPVGMAAYVTGQVFRFIAAGVNTGATTININSIGAKAVIKLNGSPLIAGDIPSGAMLSVSYDGTSFQLQTTLGVTSFSGGVTGLTPSSATTGAVTLAGVLGKLNGGTGALTATITSVSRTSSVSTITTSGVHGFVTGDYVTVAAVTNTTFNGNFTITGTPTTTSFTYAQALGNVTAAADTGTVTDLSYVNLTTNVTGILYPNFGGTGVATIPTGNLVTGNATSSITTVAPTSNGQSLIVTAGTSTSMGSLVPGGSYTITTVGSGNWTSIGASAATVGITFVCNTTTQTGTGAATLNTFATGSSLATSTAQATTSGTTKDFTGIPSWAKRVNVIFNEVAISGTDNLLVVLGTTSSLEVTGYISTITNVTSSFASTTAFDFGNLQTALSGVITFSNISGNIWIANVAGKTGATRIVVGGGSKTLASALTRLQIKMDGTNTFSTGSINISYE